MAESDLLKKEDVDDITDVLQVAPHQKNTQFSHVAKAETGDLVSLDELYEKTGQEAIKTFIDGFRELARSNRLSRAHGMALNIQGAENWFCLPDHYNAMIGKESFFGTIKQGIVKIVKAIIAFIKGVCNWIYARVGSLLGFSKTLEESRYIHEKSESIRKQTELVLTTLGVSGYDAKAYLETVEGDLTYSEILSLTKARADDQEAMFERLKNVQALVVDAQPTINGWNKNLLNAQRGCDAIMGQLRRLLTQRNGIIENEVEQLSRQFVTIIKEHLDPKKPTEFLDILLGHLYGIEFTDLGVDADLKARREELKNQVDHFKGNYDKDLVAEVDKLITAAYKTRFSTKGYQLKIDSSVAANLSKLVKESDARLISDVTLQLANAEIEKNYLAFCRAASTYAECIELILNTVQRIDKNMSDIFRWRSEINMLVPAVLVGNFKKILATVDKLSPETQGKLDGHPEILMDMLRRQFIREKKGGKDIDGMVANIIQNFLASPRGKNMLLIYQRYQKEVARYG